MPAPLTAVCVPPLKCNSVDLQLGKVQAQKTPSKTQMPDSVSGRALYATMERIAEWLRHVTWLCQVCAAPWFFHTTAADLSSQQPPLSPSSPAHPPSPESWRIIEDTPTHPPPPQLSPTHWGSASVPRPGPILPLSPVNNSKPLPFPLHLPAGSSGPDQPACVYYVMGPFTGQGPKAAYLRLCARALQSI